MILIVVILRLSETGAKVGASRFVSATVLSVVAFYTKLRSEFIHQRDKTDFLQAEDCRDEFEAGADFSYVGCSG